MTFKGRTASIVSTGRDYVITLCTVPCTKVRSRKHLSLAAIFTIIIAIGILSRFDTPRAARLQGVLDAITPVSAPGGTVPEVTVPDGTVPSSGCEENLAWLAAHNITYPIDYVSRNIIAVPRTDAQRLPLTVVEQPLFDTFSTFDLAKSETLNPKACLAPLELEVPHSAMPPIDASDLIFGMQTTMSRLKDTVKHLARWLPHTGARLFVIVKKDENTPAAGHQMREVEQEMRDLGINAVVMHPVHKKDPFSWRYFSLISVMYAARDEKTQWVINIDDDTFFPSMWDLQNELRKHDSTQALYVGSLSEDWWAVDHYGLMGFGGAGIYISLPMAKIMEAHPECLTDITTTAGDIAVMDCIYRFTPIKLTSIPTMHQVDMHGDLSGFYESGREMVSLHHWKSGGAAGFPLDIHKMHLVADICDSCFLQRFQFPNDIILSNGFSITSYPRGHITGKNDGVLGTVLAAGSLASKVEKINLAQMEETWNDQINVRHSLCPCRPRLAEGDKVAYRLIDSMIIDGETVGGHRSEKVVRQIYHRQGKEVKVGGRDGASTMTREKDTIMVLNWWSAPTSSGSRK